MKNKKSLPDYHPRGAVSPQMPLSHNTRKFDIDQKFEINN